MLLHHFPSSTCSQKVRLVLAEKNLSWESRVVDLHRGAQFDPAYLILNPAGVVPTLDTGNEVLRESSVINEYLEDLSPQPRLMPAEPHLRAQVRLWIRRLDDEVHPAIGSLTFASTAAQRRARLEQQGETIASFVSKVPAPDRRKRQEEVLTCGTDAPVAKEALKVVSQLFLDLDLALGQRDWLVGKGCTLADLSYVPYILRIYNLSLDKRLGMTEVLQRWFHRMQERQSYSVAIAEWANVEQECTLREASLLAWHTT